MLPDVHDLSPSQPPYSLGEELRRLRHSRGLSLAAVSSRADVTKATLSYWEGGRRVPSGAPLQRVLALLKATPREEARLLVMADPAYARVALLKGDFGAPVNVGQVLKSMRLRRGITQTDLARSAGVAQGTVAKWESGDLIPSMETIHTVCFAVGATGEEVATITTAKHVSEAVELDYEARFEEVRKLPGSLWEIGQLGLEADLWRAAVRDPAWDEKLVEASSKRMYGYVFHCRFDDIRAEASHILRRARAGNHFCAATPIFFALASARFRQGMAACALATHFQEWIQNLPESHQKLWAEGVLAELIAKDGEEERAMSLAQQTLQKIGEVRELPEHEARRALADVRLAAGNGEAAVDLLSDDHPFTLYTRCEAWIATGKEPPEEWVAILRDYAQESGLPIDVEKVRKLDDAIGRIRRAKV